MSTFDYKDLSLSEKVLLVEEIWDSIAEDKLKLSKQQKALLSERIEVYKNSDDRVTWESIKKNIRAKKSK